MDDPWGSPWASSDPPASSPNPSRPQSQNLLSLPPKAFFGSNTTVPSPSPWADDDAFGDWAAPDAADSSPWGDDDLKPRDAQLSPGRRREASSSRATSRATSPSLQPLPRAQSSARARQPSPDPWANETSSNDRPRLEIPNILTTPSFEEDGDLHTSNKEGTFRDIPRIIEAGSADSGEEQEPEISEATYAAEQNTKQNTNTETRDDEVASAESSTISQPHLQASRPPSPATSESHHGTERQDSPITPVDEDPKLKTELAPNSAPGKVQALVGLYDGLALAAVDEPSPPRKDANTEGQLRSRSTSRLRSTVSDEDSDFEDFEEAKAEEKQVVLDIATSTDSVRSPTPKALTVDHEASEQLSAEELPVEDQDSPHGHSAAVKEIIEKYGPLAFAVDVAAVDKLFPDLSLDDGTESELDMPDRIIDDSFSTIAERKTWYRISRYGSMRKHDFGDDENYRGINWSTTFVHSDTIKIVRRWMEEDSYTGRPTLGGTKRTSVFNWDSAGAPVDLNSVFAHRRQHSRQSQTHASTPSISSTGVTHTRGLSKDSIASPTSAPPIGAAPVAQFGWASEVVQSSSGTNSVAVVLAKPLPSPTVPRSPAQGRSEDLSPSVPPRQLRVELATRDQQISALTHESNDDEEDEWGEMVSSPTVAAQPPTVSGLALATGPPNHQTSWGLDQSQPGFPTEPMSENGSKQQLGDAWQQKASLAQGTKHNPWSSADFSIFDPLPPSPLSPEVKQPAAQLLASEEPKTTVSTQQPSGGSQLSAMSPISQVTLGPFDTSNDLTNTDEYVRNIVQNLPDLSYMLR